MYLFFWVVGIVCLVYFFCIMFLLGLGPNFYYIWSVLGVSSLLFSFVLKKGIWTERLPFWLRRLFLIAGGAAVLLFFIVELGILSGFSEKANPGLDYLIVLGAQMKSDGPSRALRYRLDEAVRYLEKNENTIVVVSGGQGADEPMSEAQGMYEYLIEKGISRERILREDLSRNTVQNLLFSGEMLDKKNSSVGIVSNNFHIFRAVKIAKRSGYGNVCGIAAKGETFLQCNNMLREFFGVVKDFLAGNMQLWSDTKE